MGWARTPPVRWQPCRAAGSIGRVCWPPIPSSPTAKNSGAPSRPGSMAPVLPRPSWRRSCWLRPKEPSDRSGTYKRRSWPRWPNGRSRWEHAVFRDARTSTIVIVVRPVGSEQTSCAWVWPRWPGPTGIGWWPAATVAPSLTFAGRPGRSTPSIRPLPLWSETRTRPCSWSRSWSRSRAWRRHDHLTWALHSPSGFASAAHSAITTQPASQSVAASSTASFSAAASGSPTPTVQWQVSTDAGTTWANVTGATSTTYSFTATASNNGYQYEAVFTNSAGTATTAPATLTVTQSAGSPTITTQPASESVAASSTASFSAAASGPPTPTVQWQVSTDAGTTWANVTGATSTTYSFTTTSSENGYQYEAAFTHTAGRATTAPA